MQPDTQDQKPKSGFKAPDTFLIIFWICVLAWIATFVVPAGVFTDAENGIKLENFQLVGTQPKPLFAAGGNPGFLNLLFDGMISSAVPLIAFLLIIGGVFGIVMRTGAMEAGLQALVKGREQNTDWLPPLLFVLFSLGGATFGMSEESIVFVIILLPAFLRFGYDSLTVLATVFVATQIGFGTSWMNPFSVVVAQGIADVDPLSGANFRLVMWAAFTTLGAAWVWNYARAVRAGNIQSRAAETDIGLRSDLKDADDVPPLSVGHILVLTLFIAGIVWVVWGVGSKGYYFPELAAQFLAIGLASAIIARIFNLGDMDFNDAAKAFQEGASQLVPAALVIGLAKGVIILLGGDAAGEPSVLNTILASLGSVISSVPEQVVGSAMFLSQALLNLAVSSGSSQAALTMPIMAPLADLAGLSRQNAVLAFQLGDGFTNLITPASPVLIALLATTRLSWLTWAAFIWRFLALCMVLGMGVMTIAVAIGYS